MTNLLIMLCSLFIALPLYANPCMQMLMGGTTTAAEPPAACTTQASPTDMETYAGYYSEIHTTSAVKYVSSMFVAGGNDAICKICLSLYSSTGTSPTYSQTLYIYGDDEGKPNGADVKDTFETRDMTGVLTGSYAWVCWTSASPFTMTKGTTYHVVTMSSGYDATNVQKWGRDATCASEAQARSADGSSWTSIETARCGMMQLYKE